MNDRLFIGNTNDISSLPIEAKYNLTKPALDIHGKELEEDWFRVETIDYENLKKYNDEMERRLKIIREQYITK